MRLIYLASPYSDPSEKVRVLRRGANDACMSYYARVAEDVCIYSPLVHWGWAAEVFELPSNFTFWKERDLFWIRQASAVWVLPLLGYKESAGLTSELEFCNDIGRPVSFVQLTNNEYYLTDPEAETPVIVEHHPREYIAATQMKNNLTR